VRVLVTGGASGLGAALVKRFAERGDHVLSADLSGRHSAPTEPPSDNSTSWVLSWPLDVRSDGDWADIRRWVEREWGGLDVLVNNAGVAGGGRLELCSIDDWRRMIEVNLLGVVRGTQTFAPLMKQQGSGRVVNTASLAGLVHPPGMGSYNAVKAAVVAFSETMSHELAPYGVGCTVVCPSYFRTNLMDSMRGADTDLATHLARLVEKSPISADDIAVAVLDGIDRGLDLVVPDEPARSAYALKLGNREAYDAQMRSIAERAKERGE
jgi:NAD(P)-dependent dehydrogenase (short-subunit alcohol dehydrogenase family)